MIYRESFFKTVEGDSSLTKPWEDAEPVVDVGKLGLSKEFAIGERVEVRVVVVRRDQ